MRIRFALSQPQSSAYTVYMYAYTLPTKSFATMFSPFVLHHWQKAYIRPYTVHSTHKHPIPLNNKLHLVLFWNFILSHSIPYFGLYVLLFAYIFFHLRCSDFCRLLPIHRELLWLLFFCSLLSFIQSFTRFRAY